MRKTDLLARLDAYLTLREVLGFSPQANRLLLQDFVAYLEEHNDGTPIRAQLAVAWACGSSPARGVSGQAARLRVARAFLTHLKISLPETEIPPGNLLATPRRPQPFLFSAEEIRQLLAGAARFGPKRSLRPHTHQTLFGLLACTGMRSSEAVNLLVSDVQLNENPPRLMVRKTKFQKSRWVPLHPSTVEQLQRYAKLRHELNYSGLSDVFFVSEQGQRLDLKILHRTFGRLIYRLDINPRPGQRNPTLHSFRHTFAVNRLRAWYESGVDPQALLPNLSVYLGHLDPASTYWYLTAIPDLLNPAAQLFERYAEKGELK